MSGLSHPLRLWGWDLQTTTGLYMGYHGLGNTPGLIVPHCPHGLLVVGRVFLHLSIDSNNNNNKR